MGRTSECAEIAAERATVIAVEVLMCNEVVRVVGSTERRSDGTGSGGQQRLEIQTAKCVE